MSKGLGRYIGIKFTQPLVGEPVPPSYPSYKFYRWNILSGWSSYLYLYEIEMFYKGVQIPNSEIINISASSQYSSYAPTRAFDESLTSFWYTRTIPSWMQIEFNEAKPIDAFRWYTRTSSYKPKDFIFQGSNDGIGWTNILEGISPQTHYWVDFEIEPSMGEQLAFKVIGEEYLYEQGIDKNGPLEIREYEVKSVSKHPTEANSILLDFDTLNLERFNNVRGNLTIEYDASKGSLAGSGGLVESFIKSFMPLDLVRKPQIGHTHIFDVGVNVQSDFIRIYYSNYYGEEKFSITASATSELIPVGVVNP